METIIKKAIEGGWRPTYLSLPHLHNETEKEITLDPLFWQALGKACGWHFCRYHGSVEGGDEEGCTDSTHDDWCQKAVRFHEINLTEGWDAAVKYLSDLTHTEQE